MKVRPVGAELLHADRQTDMRNIVDALGNFAEATDKTTLLNAS